MVWYTHDDYCNLELWSDSHKHLQMTEIYMYIVVCSDIKLKKNECLCISTNKIYHAQEF